MNQPEDDLECESGNIPGFVRMDTAGATLVRSTELATTAEVTQSVETSDMRGLSAEEVTRNLGEMLGEEHVAHGSIGTTEVIDEFDPARSKLSGKEPSVYATDDPEVAILNAVLDKHGSRAAAIRQLDGGEGASSQMVIHSPGSRKFVIPENMARAIQVAMDLGPESPEWQSLFGEGTVYLFPKGEFSQDSPRLDGSPQTTDHEWNSQDKVRPNGAVLVSPDLIKDILRFDGEDANVEILPVDEVAVAGRLGQGIAEMIPMTTDVAADDLIALAGDSRDRLDFIGVLRQRTASQRIPREEFVKLATEVYREALLEKAKA